MGRRDRVNIYLDNSDGKYYYHTHKLHPEDKLIDTDIDSENAFKIVSKMNTRRKEPATKQTTYQEEFEFQFS